MRMRLLIAALALPLALTSPIHAQRLVDVGSNSNISSTQAAPRDLRAPGPGFFGESKSGVRVARDTFVTEDGSADVREGVIGTMPLAENVDLGVGVYKVGRYSNKEPSFKKVRVMDVDGRAQKIAAVGLSIRF